MLGILLVACGMLLILIILIDAFETIVLLRRVTRRLHLSRQFIRLSWRVWSAVGRHLPAAEDPEGTSPRDRFLSIYGPVVLLLLVVVWAGGLVVGFALVFWGLQPRLAAAVGPPTFGTLLYLSGETFFTLGYGDVAPLDTPGRIVAVIEVGNGFTFLALIIGYLPGIYQEFSRREVNITLLDARAGSPPSATELLRRMAVPPDLQHPLAYPGTHPYGPPDGAHRHVLSARTGLFLGAHAVRRGDVESTAPAGNSRPGRQHACRALSRHGGVGR